MKFWFKAALLVAAAAVVPACNANNKLAAPQVVAVLPTTVASIIPNILVQFDRPMDPATAGNVQYYAIYPGSSTTSIGFTLQFLGNLNEVRLIPTSLLAGGTTYHVYVAGSVKSAENTPMGSTIHFDFNTAASPTTTSQISWAGATAAPGANSGEITISWAANAQGTTTTQTTLGDIVANYDVYLSTTSGSEDLMLPAAASQTTSPITLTGLTPGTTYFIKVQPRDSTGCVFLPLTEISAVATP